MALTLLVLLAGCGSPSGPPLVRRAGLEDLLPVLLRRIQTDGTARSRDSFRITLGSTVVTDATGSSSVRLGPQGPTADASTTTGGVGVAPTTTRMIVTPDSVFIGPPPEQRPSGKEWIRLAPDLSDPYSRAFAPLVGLQRLSGTRVFCFTELGAASVVGSEEQELEGVPVVRYSLHIDISRPADDEATASRLRGLGLTAVDTTMIVDGLDRVVSCRLDQALPRGAGSVVVDQRFDGFGEPVDVAVPPSDRVLALPAG